MKTAEKIFLLIAVTGLSLTGQKGFTQGSITNLSGGITPQSLFHIHDNHSGGQVLQLTNTTSGYTSSTYGFAIEFSPYFKTFFKNQYNNNQAGFGFQTYSGGLQERLTILNNGNVGIGNINPDEEFVVGTSLGSGWAIPAITVGGTAGGGVEMGNGTYSLALSTSSGFGYGRIIASDATGWGDGNLVFETDRIGIGSSTPSAKLHVETTGSLRSGYFKGTGTGLNYTTLRSENTSTGSGIAAYFLAAGTDATLVIGQESTATGPLFKAFGANGGEEEFRINTDGTTILYNGSHTATIQLDPSESGSTDAGQITLYNSSGSTSIEIDGDYGSSGYGRISTNELEITGGADLAEPFSIEEADGIEPGMVLSIDPVHPGKLKIADREYDRCVAGVRSGASNIRPGLILRQAGTEADGNHLVALSGRVWCLVDASGGAIEPGDLLTSSSTPGYAMKAVDPSRTQGAVIGKAMTSLPTGKGLVLVLVSLQ